MELWQLYLLVTIPGLKGWFLAIVIALILLTISYYIASFIAVENRDDELVAPRRLTGHRLAVSALLISFLIVLTPARSDLYWIVGGYVATNIEGISDLPPNLVRAANQFLEDYTEAKEE